MKKQNINTEIAGRTYEPEDYKRNDELSQGLAITHEQVTDTLAEGEVNAVIDDVKGKDVKIGRK